MKAGLKRIPRNGEMLCNDNNLRPTGKEITLSPRTSSTLELQKHRKRQTRRLGRVTAVILINLVPNLR